MIKRDLLLKKIDELIDLEKRLIPLLNRHISSSLFFSDLEKKERETILEQFQKRVTTQARHANILSGIRDEVSKSKADVY